MTSAAVDDNTAPIAGLFNGLVGSAGGIGNGISGAFNAAMKKAPTLTLLMGTLLGAGALYTGINFFTSGTPFKDLGKMGLKLAMVVGCILVAEELVCRLAGRPGTLSTMIGGIGKWIEENAGSDDPDAEEDGPAVEEGYTGPLYIEARLPDARTELYAGVIDPSATQSEINSLIAGADMDANGIAALLVVMQAEGVDNDQLEKVYLAAREAGISHEGLETAIDALDTNADIKHAADVSAIDMVKAKIHSYDRHASSEPKFGVDGQDHIKFTTSIDDRTVTSVGTGEIAGISQNEDGTYTVVIDHGGNVFTKIENVDITVNDPDSLIGQAVTAGEDIDGLKPGEDGTYNVSMTIWRDGQLFRVDPMSISTPGINDIRQPEVRSRIIEDAIERLGLENVHDENFIEDTGNNDFRIDHFHVELADKTVTNYFGDGAQRHAEHSVNGDHTELNIRVPAPGHIATVDTNEEGISEVLIDHGSGVYTTYENVEFWFPDEATSQPGEYVDYGGFFQAEGAGGSYRMSITVLDEFGVPVSIDPKYADRLDDIISNKDGFRDLVIAEARQDLGGPDQAIDHDFELPDYEAGGVVDAGTKHDVLAYT